MQNTIRSIAAKKAAATRRRNEEEMRQYLNAVLGGMTATTTSAPSYRAVWRTS